MTDSASTLADTFLCEVFHHHGIPDTIVSDRDPRFTAKLWKILTELCGIRLKMSSSHHPRPMALLKFWTEWLRTIYGATALISRRIGTSCWFPPNSRANLQWSFRRAEIHYRLTSVGCLDPQSSFGASGKATPYRESMNYARRSHGHSRMPNFHTNFPAPIKRITTRRDVRHTITQSATRYGSVADILQTYTHLVNHHVS